MLKSFQLLYILYFKTMDNLQFDSSFSTRDQIQEGQPQQRTDPQKLIALLEEAYQYYGMPPHQFFKYSSHYLTQFSAQKHQMLINEKLEQVKQLQRQGAVFFESVDDFMKERDGNQQSRLTSSQLPSTTKQTGGSKAQYIPLEEQQEATYVSQDHQNFYQRQQMVLEREDEQERQTQPAIVQRRRDTAQFLPNVGLDKISERSSNFERREPTATDPSIFEGERSIITFSSASSHQNSPDRSINQKPAQKSGIRRSPAITSISTLRKDKPSNSRAAEVEEALCCYMKVKRSDPVSARQGESKEEDIVSARFPEVKEELQIKMEKKSGL